MYLSKIIIENFRCFGEGDKRFELSLKPGLTALVGENDAGKTAVMDALRLVMGTTDQERYRLNDTDLNEEAQKRSKQTESVVPITIFCEFRDLSQADKRAFVEHLTYGDSTNNEPVLYVKWAASKNTNKAPTSRSNWQIDARSGKKGNGPSLVSEVKNLLRATYLRPQRDADDALSSGRGSRLAQILLHTQEINSVGERYDRNINTPPENFNVLGIGDFANSLLENQQGIKKARGRIDENLKMGVVGKQRFKSRIKVGGAAASDDTRLRQLLEKFDLNIDGKGKAGLGSSNLLFIASELLLLAQDAQEDGGNKLLLIEEPEAHIHAQRQLKAIKSLQKLAENEGIQVIITTHSPNLASAIALNNLVLISNGHAFSMADEGQTKLDKSDYRFLERFLDVTKANLFFACGVMIVEGDAENILLPTLAYLIGRDFTEHGVSIVNVGGVGLRRYARIFQRVSGKELEIPVACVADLDVMPNCAPSIVGKKLNKDGSYPKRRQWRVREDFENEERIEDERVRIKQRASGQFVQTFVSDQWTLEYDLTFSGLAEDVYVAAYLAKKDEALSKIGKGFDKKVIEARVDMALKAFKKLEEETAEAIKDGTVSGCSYQELLAAQVYSLFTKGAKASKAITAQYLANRLLEKALTPQEWRTRLPKYLVEAIEYVTPIDDAPSNSQEAIDE